ncbi:hypothetical protein [Streptomyces galbus]|uniref:Uncharacterized protein n=1 Tax=Streptomyces galbus TaxID=33898 RepID=A0A4U5WWT5_STRGB|nr:hypothetical protein [Streptomyces galbus]TKT06071.1 hypothetical protein E4U92_30145 [Streptomyces galbus]GHD38455.1 hypothetical protein GCM10010335_37200 [Streptomyces galbus]
MSKKHNVNSVSAAWERVNLPPETTNAEFSACCVKSETGDSPIDAFYGNLSDVLRLGLPDALAKNDTLGRLLALGIVTGTESYFRSIFLGLINTCPLVREKVADQLIALGAVDYYGPSKLGMGLFEGVSFASESEIKKRSGSLLGFSWQPHSSLAIALNNFDVVCHIRHASVHSHGVLSRGNAKALGLRSREETTQIVLDFAHLQKIALICTSAVREFNLMLYKATVEKWVQNRILVGAWSADKVLMRSAFDLFRSRVDGTSPRDAYRSYLALQPLIRQRWSHGNARR